MNLPGRRLVARDLDRRVTEVQGRIAVMNGDTALGLTVAIAVGQFRPGIWVARSQATCANDSCQLTTRSGWRGAALPDFSAS